MPPAPNPLTSNPDDSAWWHVLDPWRSLRARAALLVGGTAIGFTVLLNLGAGVMFRRTIEAERNARFESLAFQLGDKLDRAIYERHRALQFASRLPAIRGAGTARTEAKRVLETLQDAGLDLSWVGIVDASGRVLIATGGLFEGSDVTTQPWFRGAQERPFIGPPRERPDLARATPADDDGGVATRFLDLAVPVMDEAGRFGGVVAAHVRWNWSRDVLLSVVPDTLTRDRIGATLYDSNRDVLLDSGVTGWSQPPDPPAIPETRGVRGAMVEQPAGGAPFFTGYARSRGHRDYRGLGWITVVRQPLDLASASVVALQRGIVIWGGLLAVGGAAIAWVVAGRTARRLRAIGASARRIHGGDVLAVLPRPRGTDELAGMNRSLDNLVEDWRVQQATLAAERDRLAAQLHARDAEKR